MKVVKIDNRPNDPVDRAVDAYVTWADAGMGSVALKTVAVMLGTSQMDVVKGAKRAGIKVAVGGEMTCREFLLTLREFNTTEAVIVQKCLLQEII